MGGKPAGGRLHGDLDRLVRDQQGLYTGPAASPGRGRRFSRRAVNLDPTTIRKVRRAARALLLLAACTVPVPVQGQDQSAQLVEVILNQSVSVPLAAVSHALVVDESICRLEIDAGTLRVFGLKRGETVVVAWRNDQPESLLVRVASPPPPPVEALPTLEELDAMGHGTVGALAHMSTTSSSSRHLSMLTPFAWTQGSSEQSLHDERSGAGHSLD